MFNYWLSLSLSENGRLLISFILSFLYVYTQVYSDTKKMKKISSDMIGYISIPEIVSILCFINFSMTYYFELSAVAAGLILISVPKRCR